jgi:hypothetical protein
MVVIGVLMIAAITYGVGRSSKIDISKQKLEDVKKYKYYLDKGNKDIEKKMIKMDLVIVEPVVMQQQYISAAQAKGTLIYGYINSMEGDTWNKELYDKFEDEDFYKDEQGNRKYYEKWDSYKMDMTSQHYQDVLLEEIEKQVVQKGLDGVFLDTVGNIDSYFTPSEQEEQNHAIEQFVVKIKKQFNGLSIAQNWGFDTLANYTAPYIDFIMWEDFSYAVVAKDDWSLEMMDQLRNLRKEYGIQVMTVGFTDEAKSRRLAKRNNFKYVFNGAGSIYNEW